MIRELVPKLPGRAAAAEPGFYRAAAAEQAPPSRLTAGPRRAAS